MSLSIAPCMVSQKDQIQGTLRRVQIWMVNLTPHSERKIFHRKDYNLLSKLDHIGADTLKITAHNA